MHKLHLASPENVHLPDVVSIRKWFAFYAVLLLGVVTPLGYLIHQAPDPFWNMLVAVGHIFREFPKAFYKFWTFLRLIMRAGWEFQLAFQQVSPAAKLLFGAIYLSLCTTFIPLPTGFLVALLATKKAGIGSDMWSMILILSTLGAVASTIANLNDYHVFMWLLRHRRIAKIRDTKTYHVAAKWFAKGPFAIMVIFNIIHIPVDVPRMLAAIFGYPRRLFAASNFVGRFIRYAIIAFITYKLGRKWDWLAPLSFLALGFLIAMVKILPSALARLRARRTNPTPAGVSGPQDSTQEKER